MWWLCPLKLTQWNPELWHRRTWPALEIITAEVISLNENVLAKVGSLIQDDSCPYWSVTFGHRGGHMEEITWLWKQRWGYCIYSTKDHPSNHQVLQTGRKASPSEAQKLQHRHRLGPRLPVFKTMRHNFLLLKSPILCILFGQSSEINRIVIKVNVYLKNKKRKGVWDFVPSTTTVDYCVTIVWAPTPCLVPRWRGLSWWCYLCVVTACGIWVDVMCAV